MTIEERSSERMRAATALASLAIPVGATVILAIDWNDGTPEGIAAFNAYNAGKGGAPSSAQQTNPVLTQASNYDPSKGGPTMGANGSAATQQEFDQQRLAYLDFLTKSGQITPQGGNANPVTMPQGLPVEDPSDPWSAGELAELRRLYPGYF